MQFIVVLGIVLCLLGAIGNNLGNNLQSIGLRPPHNQQDRDANTPRTSLSVNSLGGNDRLWTIGTVIYVSGAILLFASFALAPASLLAPLESIQFVTNVIFSKFWLRRTVTVKMIVGTSLIVGGTIMALVSGPHVDPELSLENLIGAWKAESWLIYLACMGALAGAAFLLHQLYNYRMARDRPLRFHKMVAPLTYALYSAIIGTQSVVEAKCMAELIELWLSERTDIWAHWYTYICVALWIPLVSVWLYQLNDALSKYDPLFMIPLLQANFILFAVLSGGMFFGEFNNLSLTQWSGFIAGVTVMFIGLYLLASSTLAMEREHLTFRAGLTTTSFDDGHLAENVHQHSLPLSTYSHSNDDPQAPEDYKCEVTDVSH